MSHEDNFHDFQKKKIIKFFEVLLGVLYAVIMKNE